MVIKNASDYQFRSGPRKQGRSYKGFYLPKNIAKYKGDPCNVVYRSLMELRAMQYFDSHSDVLEWSSEETIIPYQCPLADKSCPKIRRYFVDFLIKCRIKSGEIITYLIEIKPSSQVLPPVPPKTANARRINRYKREVATYLTNEAKWNAATAACKKQGWTFKILTEKTLRF